MARYRLVVAYDGSGFHGWQRQTQTDKAGQRVELRTVQGEIERAAAKVLRERVDVLGASRTDTGVHAWGQVCAFTSRPDPAAGVGWPAERGTDKLLSAINGSLPGDILVRDVRAVPLGFNPIGGARSKAYTYTLHRCPRGNRDRPLWDRDRVFFTYYPLDVEAMSRAAAHLVGEHDFAALTQIDHGRKTTVRTIFDCRVTEHAFAALGTVPPTDLRPPGVTTAGAGDAVGFDRSYGRASAIPPRVQIHVSGSGFLYNMVRIIAGTLLEVGRGRIDAGDVPTLLASGDRRRAGPTLPPSGLRLEWISYE